MAGPVVPLTLNTGNSDELLGGAGATSARADATATGVLVKGDAVAAPSGRADDFIWPRGGATPQAAAVPQAGASAAIAPPVQDTVKPATNTETKPKPAQPAATAKPADAKQPRAAASTGSPFGWMR